MLAIIRSRVRLTLVFIVLGEWFDHDEELEDVVEAVVEVGLDLCDTILDAVMEAMGATDADAFGVLTWASKLKR